MADRNSTPPRGAPPFLLSKPVPAVLRGDLVHVVGAVAFADFRRAVCAWSAADAERAEVMELQLKAKHESQDAPLRRCDDCQLHLGRDVLRALVRIPLKMTGYSAGT